MLNIDYAMHRTPVYLKTIDRLSYLSPVAKEKQTAFQLSLQMSFEYNTNSQMNCRTNVLTKHKHALVRPYFNNHVLERKKKTVYSENIKITCLSSLEITDLQSKQYSPLY